MKEIPVQFLAQEDPLAKGQATYSVFWGFPGDSVGKESACNTEALGSNPGLERSLEKGMATHSRVLEWRIPWTVSEGGKDLDMIEQLSISLEGWSSDTQHKIKPYEAEKLYRIRQKERI